MTQRNTSTNEPREYSPASQLTRRRFLAGSAGLGAAGLVGASLFPGWPALAQAAKALPAPGQPNGEFLGLVPFTKTEGLTFGTVSGSGLEGRRMYDLATLSSETLVTPSDKFFIRTRAPESLPPEDEWHVRVRLYGGGPDRVPISWFVERERDLGVHVIEGTSNRPANGYGAISAARWTGVPVTDLLEGFVEEPDLYGLLISGFDRHPQLIKGSQAGASWIFSFDQLRQTGAFLATKMNGQPLPLDQGAPLRLVVPGWFGCTSIKWVQDIVVQGLEATATQHMTEYARATFQDGRPRLARKFLPASISFSSVPIRVERWKVGEEVVYRIVGVAWGGDSNVGSLGVRAVYEDHPRLAVRQPLPVEHFTSPGQSWTLWSQTAKLTHPGRYRINIVPPPGTLARRISRGRFIRRFVLQES